MPTSLPSRTTGSRDRLRSCSLTHEPSCLPRIRLWLSASCRKSDARQQAARLAGQLSAGEPGKVEHPATYAYTADHERATAVVAAVDQAASGSASAPAGMFDLTLNVVRDHGPGFTLRTRLGFSTEEKRVRVATVGARLPVVIDPADQSSVTLDLDALGL